MFKKIDRILANLYATSIIFMRIQIFFFSIKNISMI